MVFCVLIDYQLVKMTWDIDHMEKFSPQNGSSVSSVNCHQKMTWDIEHMEKVSSQYEFFCVISYCQIEKITWDIDHMEKVCPQNLLFCVSSVNCHEKMTWDIDHMEKVFPQYGPFVFLQMTLLGK